MDLTADVEISPLPPSYQPAFSRTPVRPTVLSDDDDSAPDPGGDMEWEDAPRASDRNCAYQQQHAPGAPLSSLSATSELSPNSIGRNFELEISHLSLITRKHTDRNPASPADKGGICE